MARNVPINTIVENNREQSVDTTIAENQHSPINVVVGINRDQQVNTAIPNQYPIEMQVGTKVGLPGQVLTKFDKFYKWADNPLTVITFSELPENPTTHCLYLIEDVQRLVHWTGEEWIYINTDSELLYDEDEEMIYIEERHEY